MSVLEPIMLALDPPYYMTSVEHVRRHWTIREHDFGGALARWLGINHPELRVTREVMVSPGRRVDILAEYDLDGHTSCLVFELKRWGSQAGMRQLESYVAALLDRYYVVTGVLAADQWDWKGEVPEWASLLPLEWTIDWSRFEQ